MWVANITDECILGLNFLEKYDCQVCLKESILVVGEEEIPLMKPAASVSRCCRVIAKESCTVGPWTEAIIPGQLTSKGNSRWGLVGDDALQQGGGGIIGGEMRYRSTE